MFALAGSVCAWGQRALSARSGMVNYVEGRVTLDDKALDPKITEVPEVKNRSVLATEEGRAEVLLTPGAFLRLAENSSFRMISNTLWDTRVEVVSGSGLVEIDELLKDNSITVQYGDAQIALLKKGLYRIDAGEPGSLRVYDGEARVSLNGDGVTAHKGRQVDLGTVLSASNFDTRDTDSFYHWSARRGEYIATANVSAARSSIGSGFTSSQWVFSPWYGMYTFVPAFGFGYSPFGWDYYSPVTVMYLPPMGYGGGGIGGGGFGGGSAVVPRAGNPVPSRPGVRSVAARSGADLSSAAAPMRGSTASSGGGGFSGGGGGGFSGGGFSGGGSAPAAVAPRGGGGGRGR